MHGRPPSVSFSAGQICDFGDSMLRLIAYRIEVRASYELTPANVDRAWMGATPQGFAKRCLPLLMANQAGWFILNEHDVCVTWNGSEDRSAVKITLVDGMEGGGPISHFGSGIVTWEFPFLFRTPPGWNLLVRGPSNLPKDVGS
jgi:hypothetical protein